MLEGDVHEKQQNVRDTLTKFNYLLFRNKRLQKFLVCPSLGFRHTENTLYSCTNSQ